MTMPARVQLSRRRGFRLQEHAPGAIVVRRPTRWGNPFTVADVLKDDPTLTEAEARELCTVMFDLWLDGLLVDVDDLAERRASILEHVHELAGHPLACTCRLPEPGLPDWCHGFRLIVRANTPRTEPWSGFIGGDKAERRFRRSRRHQTITPAGEWAAAL